jgi:hypothetical protein
MDLLLNHLFTYYIKPLAVLSMKSRYWGNYLHRDQYLDNKNEGREEETVRGGDAKNRRGMKCSYYEIIRPLSV